MDPLNDIDAEPKIVVVIGVSGAGKSNFIDKLLGGPTRAGHSSLDVKTKDFKEYLDNGMLERLGCGKILMIDTPGLDDLDLSGPATEDHLRSVDRLISEKYSADHKIAAIIYLHRINDNRADGKLSLVNMRHFCQRTGQKTRLDKVWLVSTMWDHPRLEQSVAETRQSELESGRWKAWIEAGAQTAKFFNTSESAQKILRDALPAQHFVLIMGPVGVGKSNFIDKLIGGGNRSGRTLCSSTARIREYRDGGALQDLGRGSIALVDTPGFDDTNRSDHDVLTSVSQWMSTAYRGRYKISAIIYLHRITDNRVGGTTMRNLRVFGQLTGEKGAARVWMVTTMWDQKNLDPRVARERQVELETMTWKPLIQLGAQAIRFFNTPESARDILKAALEDTQPGVATERQDARTALLLQEETEELGRRLRETAAGKALFNDLQQQLQRQRDAIAELKKGTPATIDRVLEAQLRQTEKDLERTLDNIEKLKVPILRKLFLYFFGKSSSTRGIDL